MLKVDALSVRYGQAIALRDVSFEMPSNTVYAVLGANGGGKSSLGLAVAGIQKSTGSVLYNDVELSNLSVTKRVQAGVVYVPEGRRVFGNLTTAENLRAGAFTTRRNKGWQERQAFILDRVPKLSERLSVKAAMLSGGEQQLLAIARALMAKPSLLILDEPSLGLAPQAIEQVASFLGELRREEGLSILLLEQNFAFASRVADGGTVLHLGEVARELKRDEIADAHVTHDLVLNIEERGTTD
jgi:branched-chain amino acid transport system ATP-binding protein